MTDIFERGPLRLGGGRGSGPEGDAVDLRALARGFWKDRLIFAAITLACGLLAAVLVAQVTPLYGSMTQILLDPREQRLVISEQVVSDRPLNDQVMDSEMSIIRSNTLLAEVIAQVDAQNPRLLDAIDTGLRPPSLLARAKTMVKGFLGSEPAAPDADMARLARIDRLIWAIRRSMETWRDGDAFVISIQIKTPDPRLSMLLADTIATQYLSQQLEGRRSSSAQAADWIELRAAELRAQVAAAEDAVEDYRASSLENEGTSQDIMAQRLVSLNEELINARVARVTAESRASEIARVIAEDGYDAIGGMFTSAAILALNSQRLDILAADAQWAESFDETHPERRKLQGQLDEVNRALRGEIQLALDTQRNEAEIARIRERTMAEGLAEAEQQYLALSRSAVGLRQLQREADAARNLYTDLLDRYTETRTIEQLQQPDGRIIERATLPGAPSSPRPRLMTFLGLLIGAVLATGVVMIRQMRGGSYGNLTELEADTGLPVFSALPERDWTSFAAALRDVERDRLGASAESIRRLRNEIAIGERDAEARSIALLSPLQDEGKTTTTLLLARLTEKADKLVVVVDCDFRHNAIQSEFKFPMERDLADLLAGDCTVLDALNTETGLGFDLLAMRDAQPQAADRLTRDTLKGILDELKSFYDVVLVNCPAVLPAAEALVIASAVDERILLVRQAETPRAAVKRCFSILDNAGLRVSGQVLTRVDPATLKDSAVYSYAG